MPDFVLVMNARSGSRDAQENEATIRRVLDESGRSYELLAVRDPRGLGDAAARAAEIAVRTGGALVGAGGDGTLNTVVHAALPAGRPFGVIPQGTFNYFARDFGIPLETEAATRALLDAVVRPVQVGLANERVFLVNASLGLYPKLLEDREAFKKRHGRSRLAAFWSGLGTLLRERGQLVLRLEQAGEARVLRTPTLFVGNNRVQLERIGIPEAPELEDGRLVAITVKPVSMGAMLALCVQGALGRLGDAESVVSFSFGHLAVQPGTAYGRRRIKIAIDGEVLWARTPLVFRPAPQPLQLLVPLAAASADATPTSPA